MRVLPVFLIVLLLAACGPSAKQIAATEEMAQAQTQTAAPTPTATLTPTPTITPSPTPSPTLTPSPTPSIPQVMGKVQVILVPLNEDVILPDAPHKTSVNLSDAAGNEIIVPVSEIDGSFATYLEPGTYTVNGLTLKNEDLGPEAFEFMTDPPEIEIPDKSCHYVGNVAFIIFRLPPGSFEEQTALVQQVAQGAPIFFQYHETGGFLMPILTEITGAGDCPNLPVAPEGFEWKFQPESAFAVPAPQDWNFLSEQNGATRGYYISVEDINTDGGFKTGLTILAIRNNNRKAAQSARELPAEILRAAGVERSTVEVTERTEGDLVLYEFEYQLSIPEDTTIYNRVVANSANNILYLIIFESPTVQWEEAWEIGRAMIDQMIFLENK
jgi:hypothetical protein